MTKKPLIVTFLGKSGSGKGTQVKLLRDKFDLDYIGTGELLRERKKTSDFTGTKIAEVIDSGGISPTCVVFFLWMAKLEEFKKKTDFNGIVFDGSPRRIKEAYMLDEALEWYEWNNSVKVILIDISDEEVEKRMLLRANEAGAEKRPEDSVEGIRKRLEWFKEEVGPVINYYEEKGKLIKINGEQTIEKVFEDILKAIENDND
ncbi:MAG: nucleoside monophosphate kinase [Candidatus Paceibacterota bacterium]